METRKILIATKTYPSISKKYKETVCTAGILLDDDETPLQWIRIYPIRFRSLEFDKRYARWSIISADIERNPKDYRVESYRIEDSSIEVIRKLDTKNAWKEIKLFVLPFQFRSTQEIVDQKKSLGIIKAHSIVNYFSRETTREWSPAQQAVQDQIDMFEENVDLEKIPYQFGYEFFDEDGDRHKYTISDWEIMQLYRNCRDKSKAYDSLDREREAVKKVEQKLEKFMSEKDLYFIIGNLKRNMKTFMIIGLFYPPIVESEQLEIGLNL